MSINKKLLFTAKNLKKTVYHHYGKSPFSFIRFIYYSLLRINTFIVFESDLRRVISKAEVDSEFRFIVPTMEELASLRQGKELPREFFCDEIYDAKTCCIALHGEDLAHIHWVYSKNDYSRFLVLSEGVCEINHVATLPKFRGRKLSLRMLSYSFKVLHASGYKRIVVVVHQNNVAFIKIIRRLEFVEKVRIKTLGPFNRKIFV